MLRRVSAKLVREHNNIHRLARVGLQPPRVTGVKSTRASVRESYGKVQEVSMKKFWIAFAIGALAGGVAAILYAPQSGASTRRKLRRVIRSQKAGCLLMGI